MSKINPDVLTFYKALEANNTREWFEPQKARFKALEAEIKHYSEELKNTLNETDEIERVKIFRIYTNASMEPQVLGGTVAIPEKLWHAFHQNFCICT